MLEAVFMKPTLSRTSLRRSVVNSASCLLQFPLTLPDAVWRIESANERCIAPSNVKAVCRLRFIP